MKLFPDYEQASRLAAEGKYTIIPVSTEILSDFITPIEALRILKNISSHVYLFESARENEFWGRYTFLGYDPKLQISLKDGIMQAGDLQFPSDSPSDVIRSILARYRSPRLEGLPSFTGGLVGYFSFDFFSVVEPAARADVSDTEGFSDLDLMLFDRVIAFDHVRQKIILIINVPAADFDVHFNRAVFELESLKRLLRSGTKAEEPAIRIGEMEPVFDEGRFEEMVLKAKEHILDGDIFQIVLSNRFSAPFEGSLLDVYRLLRTINPSPYMFYLSGSDMEIAGASPETLVKLQDGTLYTFPLAGTRPRGRTPEEDAALIEDLLGDEKELAEHDMLVDLGRNDLGRISQFGSVKVENYHAIEKFSHVMHIGSTVRSSIHPDRDALDAIESVLPAGTLSGAPKIMACRLIGQLEGFRRGIYGGAIGYIDFTGNMDMCIAIRLLYRRNGKVFIHSGAGIVADSDPKKEYQECLNKARASMNALFQAQEDPDDFTD